jgi:hypothetical protein
MANTTQLQTHPKIKYLQQRLQHIAELAAEKTAAHLKNPEKYPLPADKKSIEYALADLIKVLPKRKQNRFLDKLKDALQASKTARQQKYGDLAMVDFTQRKSIAEQVMALPVADAMKITEADLEEIQALRGIKKAVAAKPKPVTRAKQPQQATPLTLQFAIDSLTCNKTSEVRKDEITLSAIVLSSNGEQQERKNILTADFKKGDSVNLSAQGNLFSFILDDSTGTGFPVSFAATIILFEKDIMRNDDLNNKLYILINALAGLCSVAATATFFFPHVGIPLVLALVTSFVVLVLLARQLTYLSDDVAGFNIIDTLELETPPAPGDVFTRNMDIGLLNGRFDYTLGRYRAAVRWSVS